MRSLSDETKPRNAGDLVSRRAFLGATAAFTGGLVTGSAFGQDSPGHLRSPVTAVPPRVVRVTSEHVIARDRVHGPLTAEMVELALTTLTDTASAKEAWKTLLRLDDVVGVKFNRSGQAEIGTTDAVAEALLISLVEAGWPASRIVCIEAPKRIVERFGTRPMRMGYDSHAVHFGSGSDQFASVLNQVTALINVPFLKTHNIATMTCCLKNLSHGLIKHPARFHGNGCSPFVGDIVGASPIRSKLRVNLVDALRVVMTGGPGVTPNSLFDEGAILASVDPVAADTIGFSMLNAARRERSLAPVATSVSDVTYLAAAHEAGLGIAVPQGIELVTRFV